MNCHHSACVRGTEHAIMSATHNYVSTTHNYVSTTHNYVSTTQLCAHHTQLCVSHTDNLCLPHRHYVSPTQKLCVVSTHTITYCATTHNPPANGRASRAGSPIHQSRITPPIPNPLQSSNHPICNTPIHNSPRFSNPAGLLASWLAGSANNRQNPSPYPSPGPYLRTQVAAPPQTEIF